MQTITLGPIETLCVYNYTWKDKLRFKLLGIKLTKGMHDILTFTECYYYKGKYYITKE